MLRDEVASLMKTPGRLRRNEVAQSSSQGLVWANEDASLMKTPGTQAKAWSGLMKKLDMVFL
jgi:hypothetical protein